MAHQKKIILFDIDYTVFDMGLYGDSKIQTYKAYDEVYEVLSELKGIADLGILSQGEVLWQERKLLETNLKKYFLQEHTHIVLSKEETIEGIMKQYLGRGKLFLVDDRLTVLELAKKHHPELTTIWMKRGKFAKEQKPIKFKADATILNLRELLPIIKAT